MKLIYKDGTIEEFNIEDYTEEELLELFEQIETELHKRDIQQGIEHGKS